MRILYLIPTLNPRSMIGMEPIRKTLNAYKWLLCDMRTVWLVRVSEWMSGNNDDISLRVGTI